MIITEIRPARKAMSAVYIDGEYALNLDAETLALSGIKIGTEITDEYLHELINSSNARRAKEKALYLISCRDYSKKELINKIKKDYGDYAAELAANKMEELGFISDENFAKKYASDLIRRKKFSKNRSIYELSKKGINKELAQKVLEELEVNPVEQISSLLFSKYPNFACDEKVRKRAVSAMQRLGYNWEDIRAAMSCIDLDIGF